MNADLFARSDALPAVGLLVHEATKRALGQRHRRAEAAPASAPGRWLNALLPHLDESGCIVPLPRPPASGMETASVLDTLRQRVSTRAWAPVALAAARLAHFLTLAYPHEVADPAYRPAPRPHEALSCWNGHVTSCRLVLLARDVDGVAPGAHLYDESGRVLRTVRTCGRPALDTLLEQNCFQAEFCRAPALLLQVGSLADSLQRYGERGYRYMLFEDGVQMQRMYLAAAALGLGGCATGSFVQSRLDRWLGLDGWRASVLNAFALGELPQAVA